MTFISFHDITFPNSVCEYLSINSIIISIITPVSLIALSLSLSICSQELPGPCDQDHSSSSASSGELPSLAEEGAEEERDEEEMKIAWRYQAKPKVKVRWILTTRDNIESFFIVVF